jgi:S1-C subfamily serine protease
VIAFVALTACTPQLLSGKEVAAPTATAVPAPTLAPVAQIADGDALLALEGRLEQIYDRVSPSVVNIQVVQTVATSALSELPGLPFLPSRPQEPQQQMGTGSGFVWSNEGYIVTNNHVVADADKITVIFADGTSVPGKTVGTDVDSDLAVVKVDLPADRLQPVEIADSTQVKVGQLAIAIGNPFGLQGTMTIGIVSALGRYLPVESSDSQGPSYTIPDIIQTDAPINPGNSGGVLVNDEGNVVGVTAAIESPVRASAGIGFAVPSVIVQKVVPALIEQGHYDHPWMGFSGLALMPELREAMDLSPDQQGILVADVTSDSPADKAGLRGSGRQVEIDGQTARVGGDVIVAIDGQQLRDFEDLVAYLARETSVGQTVTLTVLRHGKEEAIQVELAVRPRQEVQRSKPESAEASGAWLGIQGLTLTPEMARAMDLDSDQAGVLVEQVIQGSPAHTAGLRGSYKASVINGQRVLLGGDVITAVDGRAIAKVHQLSDLMQQCEPGQTVEFAVLRDGEQIKVSVKLAPRPPSSSVPG